MVIRGGGDKTYIEEVGHIFCARDYALRLNGNNCVFYVPNLASLVPKSIWPGCKVPTRNEATVGSLKGRSTLKTLQVGKASCWITGSVVSPPSRAVNLSRGCTA